MFIEFQLDKYLMEILERDWLESRPHDYEFKKYKLLSAVDKYGSLIRSDNLISVLDEIEYHLENLYKFQHQKDILDDRMKILKGIDIYNMQLEYEYPENSPEMECIVNIANYAVLFLEKVYKDLREKWRENEKHIQFCFIPVNKLIYKKGYLLLLDYSNTLLIFSFDTPTAINDNWKKFNLVFLDSMEYSLDKISNFVNTISASEPDSAIIRGDYSKIMPWDDCAFPIMKFKLFHKLKTG